MVEAIGTNRGITPSMRKGIKGGDIRYNVDDGFIRNNEKSKDTGEYYKEIERARYLDIKHYLGDSWIDYDCVPKRGVYRNLIPPSTKSKVYRCSDCGSAYQTDTIDTKGKNVGNSILMQSMFNIVPLDKGDCGLCV